jgi:hypothetical protein
MPQRERQDGPWKMILRTYFREAIIFFFPNTAELIDWSKAPEFLDKEFQQIAPDAEIGDRFADQLVKVHRKQGDELWLLIHTEIQAAKEAKFQERMFLYNLRIFDRFQHPATSLAILCDGNASWRPNHYQFDYPDTALSFRFGMVKLLDYSDRWAELAVDSNPFAMVVMAHLKARETKQDAPSRKEWKLQLIRQLYEQGYNRSDVINLFRFIDWVMVLPKALTDSFWTELRAYEEERQMTYVTSVEKIGFERGLIEGRQIAQKEARLEGEKALLIRLTTLKFGTLSELIENAISNLTGDSLEQLTISFLGFSTLTELEVSLLEMTQAEMLGRLHKRFSPMGESDFGNRLRQAIAQLSWKGLEDLVLVMDNIDGIESLEHWVQNRE